MGISQQEALELFDSDDLIGIGMAANEVRRRKTDPRVRPLEFVAAPAASTASRGASR